MMSITNSFSIGSELALKKVHPTSNKSLTTSLFTTRVLKCAEINVHRVFYTSGIFRTTNVTEYSITCATVPIQSLQYDLSLCIFKMNDTFDANVTSKRSIYAYCSWVLTSSVMSSHRNRRKISLYAFSSWLLKDSFTYTQQVMMKSFAWSWQTAVCKTSGTD